MISFSECRKFSFKCKNPTVHCSYKPCSKLTYKTNERSLLRFYLGSSDYINKGHFSCGKVMTIRQNSMQLMQNIGTQFRLLTLSRRLGTRVQEHRKEDEKTRAASISNKSAITDHVSSENQLIDWENVNIMDHESERTSRAIREATWIRKTNDMN